MAYASIHYPLDEYLKQGISATQAIELLKHHDCFVFPQLQSGLFPAANFDNLAQDETGMSNAWLRDSACIGLVLLRTDQKEVAAKAAKAIVSRLLAIRQSFEAVISLGHAPTDDKKRPPVRFAGQDSEPRYDWANAQNDALGYSLQLIGEAAKAQILEIGKEEMSLIDLVVSYLDTIRYWEDADSGHWEEIRKVNASSIGTVIAGFRTVQDLVSDTTKIAALIMKGKETLEAILPLESKTPGLERAHDAALVFLVEPQHAVSDDSVAKIIAETEQHLMGEYGFRRYTGDSYWGPDYREHFQLGNRTADFSKSEDMALRDSYLTTGGEAQWTFIDPMIAAYYALNYQKTANAEAARQAERFMARSLKSVVTHKKQNDDLVWRVPELFFLEKGNWVPNDHLGLLWGEANLLYGLHVYQEVFGDAIIKRWT